VPLRLTRRDLVENGMRFTDNKPPYDDILVPWETETRALVTQILKLPGAIRSQYLFHTREGQPYIKEDGTASGFDSIMGRYLTKWRKGCGTHFTLHDLRKVRPSQLSRQQAQSLLNHATGATTNTYHLAPKLVDLGKR